MKKFNNRVEYQMNINDNMKSINTYINFYKKLDSSLKKNFYIKLYPNNNFWNSNFFLRK